MLPAHLCCLHPPHILQLVPFLLLKPSLILCGFEDKVVQNAGCQHNGIHFLRVEVEPSLEDPLPGCQDAKVIFNDISRLRVCS